jgi:hypothetical protein
MILALLLSQSATELAKHVRPLSPPAIVAGLRPVSVYVDHLNIVKGIHPVSFEYKLPVGFDVARRQLEDSGWTRGGVPNSDYGRRLVGLTQSVRLIARSAGNPPGPSFWYEEIPGTDADPKAWPAVANVDNWPDAYFPNTLPAHWKPALTQHTRTDYAFGPVDSLAFRFEDRSKAVLEHDLAEAGWKAEGSEWTRSGSGPSKPRVYITDPAPFVPFKHAKPKGQTVIVRLGP